MNITDICNLALNHIGRETIASLDEDTEAARTCKMHYDLQRQTLLRAWARLPFRQHELPKEPAQPSQPFRRRPSKAA